MALPCMRAVCQPRHFDAGKRTPYKARRPAPVEAFGELMMQVRQLTESARHHASVDDCTRHGVEVVEGEDG